MKESIKNRLETVRERFEEVSGLLSDPDVIGDQNQFRDLSREYAKLECRFDQERSLEAGAAPIEQGRER